MCVSKQQHLCLILLDSACQACSERFCNNPSNFSTLLSIFSSCSSGTLNTITFLLRSSTPATFLAADAIFHRKHKIPTFLIAFRLYSYFFAAIPTVLLFFQIFSFTFISFFVKAHNSFIKVYMATYFFSLTS